VFTCLPPATTPWRSSIAGAVWYQPRGLKFVERWIEFRIYDYDTAVPFNFLLGVNYVYFNLTYAERKMWDAGQLSIYYYNELTSKWEACWTYLVPEENTPHGRATCVMPGYGYITVWPR